MIVAGLNRYNQLDEKSNSKNAYDYPTIIPPLKSHIDVSTIISFATYSQHSVWITNDGKAYAIGDNTDGRISSSLPKKQLNEETEIEIKGKDGNLCKFISVVCGAFYTLYQVSSQSYADRSQLVYAHKGEKQIFLDLNGRKPLALFGGRETAAIIDSNGGIIIITKIIFDLHTLELKSAFLPNDDKPIKLACCNKFVIALGASGHIYQSGYPKTGILGFKLVKELSSKIFVDVSGTFHHCFAVSKDGKVYGRGNNAYCILGISKKTAKTDKFKEIKSLSTHKIVEAYAGYSHSLFKTKKGKLYACGWNYSGEVKLDYILGKEIVYPPAKMPIKGAVNFCSAGESSNIFFVDCEPPSNTPNKKINMPLFWAMKKNL